MQFLSVDEHDKILLFLQADFIKNGTVIFTGDVTAGFVGVLTGINKNGFSLSINERDLGGDPVVDGFNALLRRAWSPTHLLRQVHGYMLLSA